MSILRILDRIILRFGRLKTFARYQLSGYWRRKKSSFHPESLNSQLPLSCSPLCLRKMYFLFHPSRLKILISKIKAHWELRVTVHDDPFATSYC